MSHKSKEALSCILSMALAILIGVIVGAGL